MIHKLLGSRPLKESDRKHAYQLDGRHQPILKGPFYFFPAPAQGFLPDLLALEG